MFDTPGMSCGAFTGSPLVSSSADAKEVDGFLINAGSCSRNGTKYVLTYVSVENYSSWIKQVQNAGTMAKISIITILSTLLILLY